MSNCVGSNGLGLPASAVAQRGVERGDHLAHDRDNDDRGLLAGSGTTRRKFTSSIAVSAWSAANA
jgi:hypothetical protein